jgi:sodium/bile acid cotransporter 7
MSSRRAGPDNFTLALLATVLLASLLPCRGATAQLFDVITDAAIALLFFLHGAKLPRAAIVQGLTHWRLHLTVFAGTFALFPLLGLALQPVGHALLTPELYLGVLFVCTLPSTVQSSIAFTSIAGGNVSAAVVSASMSNLIGIVLTPLLVGLLLASHGGGASWHGVRDIVLQLLLPFLLGHLARHWIGGWVDRHKPLLGYTDQGTILLVVYTAFSAAVVEGLWRDTPVSALLATLAVCALLLALVMPTTRSAISGRSPVAVGAASSGTTPARVARARQRRARPRRPPARPAARRIRARQQRRERTRRAGRQDAGGQIMKELHQPISS